MGERKYTPGEWCWINVNREIGRHGRLFSDGKLVLDADNGIFSGSEDPQEFTANAALIASAPGLLGALEDLLKTAKLLYANAEGCAVNHYGTDFEEQGLPGWLDDSLASIKRSASAIARAQGKG